MKNTIKPAILYAMSFISLVAISAGLLSWSQADDEFVTHMKSKFKQAHDKIPHDRVYVTTDKPMYKPGDDIWMSVFVRDGKSLKPSTQSDIVYAELIDPKGKAVKTLDLVTENGIAKADFTLDEDAPGGMYKIKSYTNWMRNEGEDNAFFKEFQVQKVVLPRLKMKMDFLRKAYGPGDKATAKLTLETLSNQKLAGKDVFWTAQIGGKQIKNGQATTDENGEVLVTTKLPQNLATNDGILNVIIQHEGQNEAITRSIPILLNKIELGFYPEGGDVIASLDNTVAFKALDEFGKPADIEGVILDPNGNEVQKFSSYHDGMGAFVFTPQPNMEYTAKITKPNSITRRYTVPKSLERGYNLMTNSQENTVEVIVGSTEKERLHVIGQIRGEIVYSTSFDAKDKATMLNVATEGLPIGVMQLTLFDSKGIARAERLMFVNKGRELQVGISTNKSKYLPRERVDVELTIKDERGMPVPGDLAVSVVDDKLISFADDKSHNILTQLLVQADLSEEINEPNFYFNPEEEKADQALDYLLMTSGWRRFGWKEIIEDKLPATGHINELAVLKGRVVDHKGRPVKQAEINCEKPKIGVLTDNEGYFSLPRVILDEPIQLTIKSGKLTPVTPYISEYSSSLNYTMYPEDYTTFVTCGGGILKMNKAMAIPDMMAVGAVDRGFDEGAVDFAAEEMAFEGEEEIIEAEEVEWMAEVEEPEVEILADGIAMDAEDEDLAFMKMRMAEDEWADQQIMANGNAIAPAESRFYRARIFPEKSHDPNLVVSVRNDFRETVYWNPQVKIDAHGTGEFHFYMSDDLTSFRITAEGISSTGLPGRKEHTIFSQLPVSLDAKVAPFVATADKMIVPIQIKNNTSNPVEGVLNVKLPEILSSLQNDDLKQTITIEPNGFAIANINLKAGSTIGKGMMNITFTGQGNKDSYDQLVAVIPQGFPVEISHSAEKLSASYQINVKNVVDGTIRAKVLAFPNVISDLMEGIASILREPYGCFEQTSTSNYPNIMVMKYIQDTEMDDPEAYAKAEALLDKGYKRLVTFETETEGYEWFGSSPGHEALTAYGLMEFNDMKGVYASVDQAMVDRTAGWLLKRRDNKGGFLKNARALDSFGRANGDITNAYIVYALSEAGFRDIMPELNLAYDKAIASKDPYQLALLSNALYNFKDKRAGECLQELLKKQAADGSWTGSTHSITVSGGKSLQVETTALAVLAGLKSTGNQNAINNGTKFLIESRSSYGGFGSTQATVLALKALSEFAKESKKTAEAGVLEVSVNGKKAGEFAYEVGHKGDILIDGLGAHLREGKNTISVNFKGCKTGLPYSLGVSYRTTQPSNSDNCKLGLTTTLNSKKSKVGETVRLTTELTNTTNEGLPMSMAVVGLPGGLAAQPWQLKELVEKKKIDFYEIHKNKVIFYYRDMAPKEKAVVNLDLKSEVAGSYTGSASSAYLYYTAEDKVWTSTPSVNVSN